ncbi:MAG: efflux RND transporter periplasmic adaptor subunit [Bacteroidaceae bacterium]|nr:efflux RND transporter periplasmic adaptor subunit [Bacteroidaceae bacterium]
MNKKFKFVALSVLALSLAACSGKKEEKKAADVPQVKVTTVSEKAVAQQEEYTATVESDVKNNIAPQSYLRIEKILVEVGDQVRAGQTLVQLDASNLKQLELQIKNQEIEFNRIDQLFKVGGASKAEWDNIKTQLDVNRTALRNLQTNTQLKSPISGIVTARNYDNGDMTGQLPVLTVEKLSPIKLVVNVSEIYFPLVKKGMSVDVKLDTYGDEIFKGTVAIIHPTVDNTTHTFPVEIRLANANQKVRPGMFARVIMNFGEKSHVVVPDEAIVKQIGAGDQYVYVLKNDGTVSYNKVELGRHMGASYEVLSGVENGAKVVIAGQARLLDGVKVEVVK